jgi:hypothetical protein
MPLLIVLAVVGVATLVLGGPAALSGVERRAHRAAELRMADAAARAAHEEDVRQHPARWLMTWFGEFRIEVYDQLLEASRLATAAVTVLETKLAELRKRTDAGDRRLVTRFLHYAALALVLPFTVLIAYLDFGIVSAVYPAAGLLLRVALAGVLVVALALTSVLALGGQRHSLLAGRSTYVRRVSVLASTVLFFAVAGLMVALAPQRSLAERTPALVHAQEQLAADEAQQPVDEAVVGIDRGKVKAEQQGLARGQTVDRLMAGGAVVAEPLLVEGALGGAELAAVALLTTQLGRARRAQDAAAAAPGRAMEAFSGRMIGRLTALGIDYEAPWADFVARLRRRNGLAEDAAGPRGLPPAGQRVTQAQREPAAPTSPDLDARPAEPPETGSGPAGGAVPPSPQSVAGSSAAPPQTPPGTGGFDVDAHDEGA